MIANKLWTIMHEVKSVEKDLEIETKNGKRYKVKSEAAVLSAIRPLFLEHKLVLLPGTLTGKLTGAVTEISGTIVLVDIEDNEQMSLPFYGQGYDTFDKGAGMAYTYGVKNLLVKLLLLTSGEDTDNTGSARHEQNQVDTEASEWLADRVARLLDMLRANPATARASLLWVFSNFQAPQARTLIDERLATHESQSHRNT